MTKDRTLPSRIPLSAEPGTVLVESERLVIRRYAVSDAPALQAAADYQSIAQWMRDGFPHPYTLKDAEDFITMALKTDGVYPEHMAVFVKPQMPDNPSAQLLYIGTIGMDAKDDVEYRTWELGYWLTPPAWGKGFATEITKTMVAFAFDMWPKLNRIESMTYSEHQASQNVLKKCGYTYEGKRRGAAEKNGIILDTCIYGITRLDYENRN